MIGSMDDKTNGLGTDIVLNSRVFATVFKYLLTNDKDLRSYRESSSNIIATNSYGKFCIEVLFGSRSHRTKPL